MASDGKFLVGDYVILSIVLLVTLVVGLIPAFTGQRQKTIDEFLNGSHKLRLLPVTISLLVTYMSGITLLGTGAEAYYFGGHIFLSVVGQITGTLATALLYVPLLYPLKLVSSNQYVTLRFGSKLLTWYGLFLQMADLVILNALVMIGPAYFLKSAAGLPIWVTIIGTGVVCSLYTSLGGLKAVIWTDVFQAVVMFVGCLIVVIYGGIKVGSTETIWDLYSYGGRLEFELVPSPWRRMDVWSVSVLQGIMWSGHYGVLQPGVQRFSSLPKYRDAIQSVLLLIPLNIMSFAIILPMGVIAFSYYASLGCDPLGAGYISNVNQIVPYMVMDVMPFQGLSGLFFSAIFASALSNASSCLAGLAALTWEDILKPRLGHIKESKRTVITKVTVLVFGVLSTGMSLLLSEVGGSMLQMAVSIHLICAVPIIVLFFLGGLWPWANAKSAMLGSVFSLAVMLGLSVSANIYRINQTLLPTVTTNCTDYGGQGNASVSTESLGLFSTSQPVEYSSSTYLDNEGREETKFYHISYLWYGLIGTLAGTIISILATVIPYCRNTEKIDGKYLFPFMRRCASGITKEENIKDLKEQQDILLSHT